ncbi:MAG: CDP-alcohol phosphatidyltransferase family protein [Acidimicrobiia bacterium]
MNTAPVKEPRFGPGALATRANALTLSRMLFAIPLFWLIITEDEASWPAVTGWFVLSITDGLDGYIARREGTTRSGAYLDPIADKFLAVGGFLALAIRGDFAWLPVGLVVGREVFISVYRSLAGRRGISLPARRLGKYKTNVQLLAVGVVLFPPLESAVGFQTVMLWLAVAFTLVSGADIVRRGWRRSIA